MRCATSVEGSVALMVVHPETPCRLRERREVGVPKDVCAGNKACTWPTRVAGIAKFVVTVVVKGTAATSDSKPVLRFAIVAISVAMAIWSSSKQLV